MREHSWEGGVVIEKTITTMSEKRKCCKCSESLTKEVKKYPGVATDVADRERVSMSEVDQETHLLNNNPRNDDDHE